MKHRIGLVMPYHDREYQLNRTLESIGKQNSDVFVVIVDDNSKRGINLPPCNFPVKVIRIGEEKSWSNPEPAYNTGFLYLIENVDCDIIINQNSECFHVGPVLEYAYKNTREDNYISFSCYSIDMANTLNPFLDISDVIEKWPGEMRGDRTNGWYNHPVIRPAQLEWCSAIHRKNLLKLNGYDERLAFGYAHGDGHLLHRIKLLGLKIEIPETPFVVHQWHTTTGDTNPRKKELSDKNHNLYNEMVKENETRAQHIITRDLCQ